MENILTIKSGHIIITQYENILLTKAGVKNEPK